METAAAEAQTFAPVFEKDGNEFIVCHTDFVADNEETAREIGLGAMLVECILLGMKSSGRVLAFDAKRLPHVPARLGFYDIAIVAGPAFDEERIASEGN